MLHLVQGLSFGERAVCGVGGMCAPCSRPGMLNRVWGDKGFKEPPICGAGPMHGQHAASYMSLWSWKGPLCGMEAHVRTVQHAGLAARHGRRAVQILVPGFSKHPVCGAGPHVRTVQQAGHAARHGRRAVHVQPRRQGCLRGRSRGGRGVAVQHHAWTQGYVSSHGNDVLQPCILPAGLVGSADHQVESCH